MSKRNQTKNLPLFADMADADQLRGFKTADERKYEEQQARRKKRKFVPLSKAPTTGPACLRCKSWVSPHDSNDLGECRHLVKTVDDAVWANVDRGSIVDRDTARKDLRVAYDHLRTGEAFSCSAFEGVNGEAYSPPVLSLSPVGPLIERVRAKRNGEAA